MEENNNRYKGPRRIGIENEDARTGPAQAAPPEHKKRYGRRLANPYEQEAFPERSQNPSVDLSRRHTPNPYLRDIRYEDGPELMTDGFGEEKPDADDSYWSDEYDAEQAFYEETAPFEEDSNVDWDGGPERPFRARRDVRVEGEPEIEPLDDDLVTYDEFGRKRKEKRIREEKLVTRSRIVWGWILSIAAAIAIALLVRAFLFEIIMVDGDSMVPTLHNNEKLAVEKVSRYFGLPERGDIIIVHYPNMEGTYVKRVMGLPGDTIEIKDSTVYVNGEPQNEPYINSAEPYMDMAAVTVPEDTVFVMGDNRAHSLDSRTGYIGPIAKDQIVGHAMSVIWPLNNIHSVQ